MCSHLVVCVSDCDDGGVVVDAGAGAGTEAEAEVGVVAVTMDIAVDVDHKCLVTWRWNFLKRN